MQSKIKNTLNLAKKNVLPKTKLLSYTALIFSIVSFHASAAINISGPSHGVSFPEMCQLAGFNVLYTYNANYTLSECLASEQYSHCEDVFYEAINGNTGNSHTYHLVCAEEAQYYLSANSPKPTSNCEGNPCDVISGRKIEKNIDFNLGSLTFSRQYDSGSIDSSPRIGMNWRHSFDVILGRLPNDQIGSFWDASNLASINRSNFYLTKASACYSGWRDIKDRYNRGLLRDAVVDYDPQKQICLVLRNGHVLTSFPIMLNSFYSVERFISPYIRTVSHPNGAFYTFEEISPNTYQEVSGYDVRLEKDGEDFLFYDTNGTIDRFVDNKMVQRTLPNKRIINLTYSENGWLDAVSDEFGQTLQFAYNENGQISSVTYPDGQIQYGFDANFNLISVTYEDDSTRQYHYEDTRHPHHLTGITDERGIRYATWTYDEEGKATSSSHANDTDRTTFTYTDNSTIVTDPSGATREYHIGVENKQLVVTHVTGDPCRDCWKGDAANREYDANGHLSRVTDWKGNVTTYVHNGRGQELSRTEAFGTPQARTITTEWHPEFNLPTRIVEPERETVMTYDERGRLLSRETTVRN